MLTKDKFFLYFLVAILLCGFSTRSLWAATYYIDYLEGIDANNGRSTASAFKHCPGDSNSTGLSASTVLLPGDVVLFKGGTKYEGQINIKWSGAADKYITYDGNSSGQWGSGKAQIDLANKYYHGFVATNKNYIHILNFSIYSGKNCTLSTDPTSAQGIIRNTYGKHWLIKNCIISRTQDWNVMCAMGSDQGVPADHTGIVLDGRTYSDPVYDVEIDNCEIYAIGRTAITLKDAQNIQIHDCDFGGKNRENNSGYFSVALRITYSSNEIHIFKNTFHDGWQYEGDDPGQRCHAGDWIHIYGNNNGVYEDFRDPHNIYI